MTNEQERRVLLAAYSFLGLAETSGSTTVITTPEAPDSPMLNRIVGLGMLGEAVEADLDEALALVPRGTTYYVAIEPGAEPAEIPRWLEARGHEPGWGWMRFRRGPHLAAVRETALKIAPVDSDGLVTAFARVVRTGYGLPEAAEAAIARAARAPGWELSVALEGDQPVAAGGVFVAEGVAYLGIAATLAEHRGKGAQSALLAHRIARAAALGCGLVMSETGERKEGLPSNSYRNLLAAGFSEAGVAAHWLGRREA
jgi:GNAT superfamily N-acetyltransferase